MICRLANAASAIVFAMFAALVAPLAHSQASPFVVTNTLDSGPGSLRAAIQAGYLIDGCLTPPTITFAIPGSGPHTISPQTELPALSCGSIDGYSQVGATANTDAGGGNNANIQIILNGSGCTGCDGLELTGSGLSVSGLAIHSFQDGAGIHVNSTGYVYIKGNYIGTDPGGSTAIPNNNGYGIKVDAGKAYIGQGGDAASRNLITGNRFYGVWVGPGSGCVAGSADADVNYNLIGGTRGGASGVANGGPGIFYANLSVCGGSSVVENWIRYNNGAGVVLAAGESLDLHANYIYGNAGVAFDLGNDGMTADDVGDSDAGANTLINRPKIVSVVYNDISCALQPCTRVTAELQTEIPVNQFNSVRFDFFHNDTSPTLPEGRFYMGFATAVVNASGYATVTQNFDGISGQNITATASFDDCGECGRKTSEYSFPMKVAPTLTTFFSPPGAVVGVGTTFYVNALNPNPGEALAGLTYTVNMPSGLRITQALGQNCAVAPSFTPSSATLTAATIPAGGTCILSLTVFPESAGSFLVSPFSASSEAGSATAPPANLTAVLQPPGVSIFMPGSAPAGSAVTMAVKVSRTASLPTYSAIGATLTLPSPLSVANPTNYAAGCGASGSTTAGATSVSATGGSHASVGECDLISFSVSFPSPGTYTVSIAPGAFTYNVPNSPTTWSNTAAINATVTVTAPSFSVSVPSLAFGNQEVGTLSSPQSVTISNTGDGSLTLSSITAPGGFQVAGCSPLPLTLPAGASCPLSVTFAPTATGVSSGNIQISSNAGGSPHTVGVSGNGTASNVFLSSAALAFGSQTVNTSSATQSVTITNNGSAALSISAIVITGDFGFTGCATPVTLAPGASCTLSVYFFPTTTGNLAGSASIVSNASASPHVITLGGTGTPLPVPGIALAPSSASFGTILVGTSASQVLALSNPGTANLDIGSISVIEIVPPPAAMRAKAVSFSQSNDCPASLAPSAACNITVTYAPTSAGTHAGQLQIVSNASPSPLVAALSGSANPATTPGLQLSASSVTFAPQFPNTTSAAQSVTLTSSGTAPLVITQVAASGDFSFSGCGPSTLAPGATCSFAITFKPFGEGPHSGAIVITSNAPGSPHTLSLSGTGSPRLAPEISLAPSDFAFGPVRTQRTVTLTSRLTNAGAATLVISQVSSTGAFFAQSNNCPSSLPIGAFCDITVTYTPTATGPHSGQLVILSNALPSPFIAALSGTGINVPPPFLDVDGALDFGQQVMGVTVRRTLTLANTGGDPLTITQMTLIGSGAFGLEGACATIAPERSCGLTVTFTPTALAAFTARLDIVSNHSGGVVQVGLSGVGTALPRPALELSVGALGFGSQGVGSTTASQTVRLTSVGAVAAQINSIAASLPDFIVDANQCPALLAPQQSCEIGVAFKPVATGGRQGLLAIQSDAVAEGGLPHSVSLIGVGCRFFTVGGSRNPQRLCAP